MTDQELVKDTAECEDIGARIDVPESRIELLGGHVGGRAHDGTLTGQIGGCLVGDAHGACGCRIGLGRELGEPPIEEDGFAEGPQDDIAWL
jgi:hypothetical protein